MTNQERRDAHLAYIADKPIFKELVRTRGLIQKLNAIDRTDEDGIRKLVRELMGTEQIPYIVPPLLLRLRKPYFRGKEFDETAWEQVRKEGIYETV